MAHPDDLETLKQDLNTVVNYNWRVPTLHPHQLQLTGRLLDRLQAALPNSPGADPPPHPSPFPPDALPILTAFPDNPDAHPTFIGTLPLRNAHIAPSAPTADRTHIAIPATTPSATPAATPTDPTGPAARPPATPPKGMRLLKATAQRCHAQPHVYKKGRTCAAHPFRSVHIYYLGYLQPPLDPPAAQRWKHTKPTPGSDEPQIHYTYHAGYALFDVGPVQDPEGTPAEKPLRVQKNPGRRKKGQAGAAEPELSGPAAPPFSVTTLSPPEPDLSPWPPPEKRSRRNTPRSTLSRLGRSSSTPNPLLCSTPTLPGPTTTALSTSDPFPTLVQTPGPQIAAHPHTLDPLSLDPEQLPDFEPELLPLLLAPTEPLPTLDPTTAPPPPAPLDLPTASSLPSHPSLPQQPPPTPRTHIQPLDPLHADGLFSDALDFDPLLDTAMLPEEHPLDSLLPPSPYLPTPAQHAQNLAEASAAFAASGPRLRATPAAAAAGASLGMHRQAVTAAATAAASSPPRLRPSVSRAVPIASTTLAGPPTRPHPRPSCTTPIHPTSSPEPMAVSPLPFPDSPLPTAPPSPGLSALVFDPPAASNPLASPPAGGSPGWTALINQATAGSPLPPPPTDSTSWPALPAASFLLDDLITSLSGTLTNTPSTHPQLSPGSHLGELVGGTPTPHLPTTPTSPFLAPTSVGALGAPPFPTVLDLPDAWLAGGWEGFAGSSPGQDTHPR